MLLVPESPSRTLRRAVAISLPLLLGVVSIFQPAHVHAQCISSDLSVVCSGEDLNGFDAQGVDGYDVLVRTGATVGNGDVAGTSALDLANDSIVTVESEATIQATGLGSSGIRLIDDGLVTHEGILDVTGDGATGIGANERSILRTRGTIDLFGADTVGVSAADASSIENFWIIRLEGERATGLRLTNDSPLLYSPGFISITGNDATGIRAGDRTTLLRNDGIITIFGDRGIGIDVGDGGDGSEVLSLNRIDIYGDSGIGLRAGDDNAILIGGSVSATGANGVGVEVGTAAGTGNTIRNFGLIAGGSASGAALSLAPAGSGSENDVTNELGAVLDGSASGLAIRGGAGADSITNNGTVFGDIRLEGGDDVLSLSVGSVTAGDLDGGPGRDVLRLGGTGRSNGLALEGQSGFESLVVNTPGTWILEGSGSFSDGVVVQRGILGIDGDVTLTGDYSQGPGSLLAIPYAEDGTSAVLAIDGNVSLDPNAGLGLLETGPMLEETTFTVLTTTGSLNGSFNDASLPAPSATRTFTQEVLPQAIAVTVTRRSYASAADTDNQKAVARYLDAVLAAGPIPDMEVVLGNLDQLAVPDYQEALDALHPESYDAHTNALIWVNRSVAEGAAWRRPRCEARRHDRDVDFVALSPCTQSWMPWIEGYGMFADRDGGGRHIDYRYSAGGLLFGADRAVGSDLLFHGFAGGGTLGLEVDDVGYGRINTISVGAGARWDPGATRVRGVLAYTHGWHDQSRSIEYAELARTAKSDYTSDSIFLLAEAGYELRHGHFGLEPSVSLDFGQLMQESFRESRGGALDLDVDERSNSVLSLAIGARLEYEIFKTAYYGQQWEWTDGIWTPEIGLGYRFNAVGADREVEASMAGGSPTAGSFQVDGHDAKHGLEFMAGLRFRPMHSRGSLQVVYDGYLAEQTLIHRIGFAIRIPLGG